MMTIRSKWAHRLVAGIAIFGITGTIYAHHCFTRVLHNNNCGTSQTVYGNDCSYWVGPPNAPGSHFVPCPNQLWFIDTAAAVHLCNPGQATGATGCDSDGETVEATRQWYQCVGGQTCDVMPVPGDPEVLDECATAKLTGSPCGH